MPTSIAATIHADKIESALIPAFGLGVGSLAPGLPARIEAERLMSGMSVLLWFQGLGRDLWLLARSRGDAQAMPRRVGPCLYVESTIGATGFFIGFILLAMGIDRSIEIGADIPGLLGVATLGLGFSH